MISQKLLIERRVDILLTMKHCGAKVIPLFDNMLPLWWSVAKVVRKHRFELPRSLHSVDIDSDVGMVVSHIGRNTDCVLSLCFDLSVTLPTSLTIQSVLLCNQQKYTHKWMCSCRGKSTVYRHIVVVITVAYTPTVMRAVSQ